MKLCFRFQDELQVAYMLALYKEEMEVSTKTGNNFDIDLFELILSITVAIGTARPENLVKFLSGK